MPVEARVDVVEETVTRHVDLRALGLLGRTAVHAHRAGDLALFEHAGRRDRPAGQPGAEHVVPAAVAVRVSVCARFLARHGGVAEPRQRVVLREEADDGTVAETPLGNERGLDSGSIRLHREARRLELAHVHLRRLEPPRG